MVANVWVTSAVAAPMRAAAAAASQPAWPPPTTSTSNRASIAHCLRTQRFYPSRDWWSKRPLRTSSEHARHLFEPSGLKAGGAFQREDRVQTLLWRGARKRALALLGLLRMRSE